MFRLVLAVFALIALTSAQNCESPQFKVTSYSTTDARLTAESAAQLEITVNCKSGKQVRVSHFILVNSNNNNDSFFQFQPSTLYADINGQVVPCAQSASAPGKYFVRDD